MCLVFGCTHPTLGRPVIVGASASSGVGASLPSGEPVDLEAVYNVVVRAPHERPRNVASGFHFSAPAQGTIDQLAIARAAKPTLIVAVDLLFWHAHEVVADELRGTPAEVIARTASIEAALRELETLSVPIVLGLLPSIDPTHVPLVRDARVPSDALRASLNLLIRVWAEERPNVLLLDIGDLMAHAAAHEPFDVLGVAYSGEAMRGFLQKDNLHPTPAGLIVMMQLVCARLEEAGLIEADDWQASSMIALASLPRAATIAANRSMGGLSFVDLNRRKTRLDRAIEEDDCAAAVEILETFLIELAELPKAPQFWERFRDGYGIPFVSLGCSDALEKINVRQAERLKFVTDVETPSPWLLDLWCQAMWQADQPAAMLERLGRLRLNDGTWPSEYEEIVFDFMGNQYDWPKAPAAFAELLPREEAMEWLSDRLAAKVEAPALPLHVRSMWVAESTRMLKMRTGFWEMRCELAVLAGQSPPPKPVRSRDWAKAYLGSVKFLEGSLIVADLLVELGRVDEAKELRQFAANRVGERIYRAYREVRCDEVRQRLPYPQRVKDGRVPEMSDTGALVYADRER